MSATALSLAAILALAAGPRCGAAPAGGEFQQRLAAIAFHESGGDPLVIGVNADAERGLPAFLVRPATPGDAASQARALMAQGRSVDLGLMQINSAQLSRHGLTLDVAFDACRSMAAGADHHRAASICVRQASCDQMQVQIAVDVLTESNRSRSA